MTVQTIVCQSSPTEQGGWFHDGVWETPGYYARIQNSANPVPGGTYGSTDNCPGWLISGVNIPQGAQITSASMLLTENNNVGAAGAFSAGTGIGLIFGDKQANPGLFSTADSPATMTKTSASCPLQADGTDNKVFSHNVTAIIQELVNQGNWTSGNAMRFAAFSSGFNGYAAYYLTLGSTPASLIVSFVTPAGGHSTGRGGLLRSRWFRKANGQGNPSLLTAKSREDARFRCAINWLLDRLIYRGRKLRAKAYLGTRSDGQLYLGERDLF